jgi:hypothetical protein
MANSLTDIVKVGSRTIHKKVVDNKIKYVPTNLEGTVIYYPMEEKTINLTLDHSALNTNHGTIYGAIECAGKIGKGLQFDGIDDYVDCGNVIDVTNKLSIIGWVKFPLDCYGVLVSKFENGYKRWHILIDGDSYIYFTVTDTDNMGGKFYGAASLANTWVHLAMVYDGALIGNVNRVKIYVNGVQKTLSFYGPDIPSAFPVISANVQIGRQGIYYSKAAFDEIRIYNRALTEQEILASYQQES